MIQDKKITIAAGAEVTVQGVGTFIGVLDVSDTTQELRVSATNKDGQTILSARMLQGERVTLDRPFNQLRIKNEGVEAVDVLLLVGSGNFESGRLTGSVALENTVSVDELAGSRIESVGAIDPVSYEGNQHWIMSEVTTSLKTIVSPSANTAGVVVVLAAETGVRARIMAKGSAPVSWDDPAAATLSISGGLDAMTVEARNIFLPAGVGIYAKAYNTAERHTAVVEYKVL